MSAPTEQEVVSGFAVWASRNGWHQDETGAWFRIQWGAPHTEPVGQLQGECLLEQCRVLLAESHLHRLPTERLAWLLTHEQFNLLRMWRPHNGSYPPCTMEPKTMAITLFGLPITRGGDRFGLVVMPVEPR